jgi:lipopolysaccharide/colanic/teichoic acid biosynthesis glycosyltransferase
LRAGGGLDGGPDGGLDGGLAGGPDGGRAEAAAALRAGGGLDGGRAEAAAPLLAGGRRSVYARFVKRVFDILLGIVALPILGVSTLVISCLVLKEDGRPVFYNAPRVGMGGAAFKMYKFRTMHVDAPDIKEPDGSTYNAPDDPRLTRIGARLRGSSLDELPQVINVLRGDMSFIGPRPDLAEEVALYQGEESLKLLVKPGMSGYAQVFGRNAIPWRDRLALDVVYVRRISFLLDLRIFFKTFAVVFSQEGVYEREGDDMGDNMGDGIGDDIGDGRTLSPRPPQDGGEAAGGDAADTSDGGEADGR